MTIFHAGMSSSGSLAGLCDPLAMVPAVYGEEIPPEVHPVAARQIQAHLDRLRRLGSI